MICPNCSTSIPDEALRCPACHADLAATAMIPRLRGRWCPSCGALVPEGSETCPSCGMLVPLKPARMPRHGAQSKAWRDFLEEEELLDEADEAHEAHEAHDEDATGLIAITPDMAQVPEAALAEETPADDAPPVKEDDQELSPEEEMPAEDGELTLPDLSGLNDPIEEDEPYMPHFDSAIPMGEDRFGIDARQERMPPTAAFLVAAAASLTIIGGTTLIITHPWNKAAFETRATDAADVSSAGYPGEVDALSGQDSGAEDDAASKEEQAFDTLSTDYAKLGEIRKSLGENEDLLITALEIDESSYIADGYSAAESATIELASIQGDLTSMEMQLSSYKEEAESLKELANWLRTWSEALSESWSIMDRAYYPSYVEQEVMDLLYNGEWYGTNAEKASFDENYVNRFPVEHKEESTDSTSSKDKTDTTSSTTQA